MVNSYRLGAAVIGVGGLYGLAYVVSEGMRWLVENTFVTKGMFMPAFATCFLIGVVYFLLGEW